MNNDKNVAIIDIEKYNELRDFKETVEKGDHIYLPYNYNNYNSYCSIYGNTEKISDEIIKRNEYLLENVESQGKKINDLHSQVGRAENAHDFIYMENQELNKLIKKLRILLGSSLTILLILIILLICL